MGKLKLNADELSVESFDVHAHAPAQAGTVHARVEYQEEATYFDCDAAGGGGYTQGTCIGPTYCCQPTWRPTCMATCPDTGQITCFNSMCTLLC